MDENGDPFSSARDLRMPVYAQAFGKATAQAGHLGVKLGRVEEWLAKTTAKTRADELRIVMVLDEIAKAREVLEELAKARANPRKYLGEDLI